MNLGGWEREIEDYTFVSSYLVIKFIRDTTLYSPKFIDKIITRCCMFCGETLSDSSVLQECLAVKMYA